MQIVPGYALWWSPEDLRQGSQVLAADGETHLKLIRIQRQHATTFIELHAEGVLANGWRH